MTNITNYPLTWPASKPRRPFAQMQIGRFSKKLNHWSTPLSVSQATDRLMYELEMIGAANEILSTNIAVRLDGLPRSGQRKPDDPAVALYFDFCGKPTCMPCDTYNDIAQNIAAIAAHIQATRSIERHGVASMAEMFTGFAALPAPEQAHHWTKVLDLPSNADEAVIKSKYRSMAKKLHTNGAHESAFSELNVARDMALEDQ